MTRIHGAVFLIVGSTISIISMSVGKRFGFFIWAGVIMALYGVFKIIMQYLDTQTKFSKPSMAGPACPGCGTKMHPTFRFCPYCSYRLKE